MKSERNVVPLILSVLFCALFLLPSPATAYCVYNHTNTEFEVCGETCSRCFNDNVDSGEHSCCPGGHKGCDGHTYITITPRTSGIVSDHKWYVPIQVTNHGWVSFFGECKGDKVIDKGYCDGLTAKVHNNDGDVIYSGKLYHLSWGHRCRND